MKQIELLKYTPPAVLNAFRSQYQSSSAPLSQMQGPSEVSSFCSWKGLLGKKVEDAITRMTPYHVINELPDLFRLPFYDVALAGIRWDVASLPMNLGSDRQVLRKEEMTIGGSGVLRIYVHPQTQLFLKIDYNLNPGLHSIIIEIVLSESAFCDLEEVVDTTDSNLKLARFLKVRVASKGYFSHLMKQNRNRGYLRSDVMIELLGECATSKLWAAVKGEEEGVTDLATFVDHRFPRTESDQFFKVHLSGLSRLSSLNHVAIRSDAQGAAANQLVKVLLLDEHADVKIKPMLDIQCDEVKANHGVTFSTLDSEELFYLQSRGISKTQCRRLLETGFLSEVSWLKEQDCVGQLYQRFPSTFSQN